MSNKEKGEFTLHDGKVICLDFNALIVAEKEAGITFPKMFDNMVKGNFSALELRALMYGGLRKYHANLSVEEAGNLVMRNADKLVEAFVYIMSDPTAEEAEDESEGNAKPSKPKK